MTTAAFTQGSSHIHSDCVDSPKVP